MIQLGCIRPKVLVTPAAKPPGWVGVCGEGASSKREGITQVCEVNLIANQSATHSLLRFKKKLKIK